jgi:hypothetical protein
VHAFGGSGGVSDRFPHGLLLRIAQRPSREIGEERGLDLQNDVVDGGVMCEVRRDRALLGFLDRSAAASEVEEEVGQRRGCRELRAAARRGVARVDLVPGAGA